MLPWLPITRMSLAWGPFEETSAVWCVSNIVTFISLRALGDLPSPPLRSCSSVVGCLLLF